MSRDASAFTLIAELQARPGLGDTLQRELQALIAPSLSEPDCQGYTLHRSSDDTDLLLIYEHWRSRDALDAHLTMPYLRDFFARTPQLLSEPVRMRYFASALPAA